MVSDTKNSVYIMSYDGNEFDHYLFKKPEWKLSEKDMATVRYVTCQLNGLQFNDGGVPYKEIDQILKKTSRIIKSTPSVILP